MLLLWFVALYKIVNKVKDLAESYYLLISFTISREKNFMPTDRYESTFVVDISGNGDITSLQPAPNALSAKRGKPLVNAGVYPITSTITILEGNVQDL